MPRKLRLYYFIREIISEFIEFVAEIPVCLSDVCMREIEMKKKGEREGEKGERVRRREMKIKLMCDFSM